MDAVMVLEALWWTTYSRRSRKGSERVLNFKTNVVRHGMGKQNSPSRRVSKHERKRCRASRTRYTGVWSCWAIYEMNTGN